MFMALNFISFAFWGTAYFLIARRGFIEKTYGLPFVLLGVDMAWVLTFTFIYPQSPFMLGFVALDLIFLYQLLRFRSSDQMGLSDGLYYAAFAMTFATSLGLILAFSREFDDVHGVYTAFIEALAGSILFVVMFYRRDSLRGQSIYIAISKMLGTLAVIIAYNFFTFPDIRPRIAIHLFHRIFNITLGGGDTPVPSYEGSAFLLVMSAAIIIFDAAYIILVYRRSRRDGIDPWRRF